MPSILEEWTTQEIMPLAPDAASVKAAQKLARPNKWSTLESDSTLLWGTIYGSGKKPYLVRVNLNELTAGKMKYKCTCPSRKQPCKHTLALLLTAVGNRDSVAIAAQPDWVQEWAAKQAEQAAKKEESTTKKNAPKNKANAAKTAAARTEKIKAGLGELELWLENLIRGGLGDPAIQSYTLWEERAARMVDAQAPAVANVLRDLAGLPARDREWAPIMLAELGRLYLMTQTFKRFEQLAPPQQADLRTALGWPIKQDEFENEAPVQDRWVVIGRLRKPLDDRLREQRIWLTGYETKQKALLLEFAFGSAPFKNNVGPGEAVEGELLFFPGAVTQRAVPKGKLTRLPIAGKPPHTGRNISAQLNQYAKMVASNPWQTEHLLCFDQVTVFSDWTIRDEQGEILPLSDKLNNLWPLYAAGGEEPLMLTGLWDGRLLLPIAAFNGQRWIDLVAQGALMP